MEMKRTAIILAFVITLPLAMFSQDKEMVKLFNQQKNIKGFELQDVDPDINFKIEDEFDLGTFLDEVEKIYILNFDKNTGNHSDLNAFSEKLDKLLDKKDFESLLDLSGESKVGIYVRKGAGDKISDFFMSASGDGDATFIWAVAP